MPTALETALFLLFSGLVLLSFLPPLVALVWLRNAERRRDQREPWRRILATFLYGAVVAVLAAAVLESAALRLLSGFAFLTIVAPAIEESAKAVGLFLFTDDDPHPQDGYVYGGAIGLGFAAVENLLYVMAPLVIAVATGGDVGEGAREALALGIYRGVATVALHASTTAIVGRAVWRLRFGARDAARRAVALALVVLALALAIGLHATYNALAPQPAGPALAIVFAAGLFAFVHARVRRV